jgi:putative membrane protein
MFAITSLPSVNATLNATSAVLLIIGYYHIRQGRQQAHRACMLAAFSVSVLFLVSYLVYHFHAGATHFTGQGWIRSVYFALLISHTILAALVPFLALLTLSRALRQQFDRHRTLAKWTLPVWLYVSVTGVVIYWLLYHVYAPA